MYHKEKSNPSTAFCVEKASKTVIRSMQKVLTMRYPQEYVLSDLLRTIRKCSEL